MTVSSEPILDEMSLTNIERLTEGGLQTRSTRQKIIFRILAFLASLTILILFATILIMVLYSEEFYKHWDVVKEAFTTTQFNPGTDFSENGERDQWGILAIIYGTFAVGSLALVFSLFFGIGSAIFLSEYVPKSISRKIQPVLEFVAAIPSIVLGLIAVKFVSKVIFFFFQTEWFRSVTAFFGSNNGEGIYVTETGTILSAAFMISILASPIIASISYDAMQSTPAAQRQAVKAFGANQREVFFAVVLPHAGKSMFASILLGFGRIIGETMIVTVVLGSNPVITWSMFTNGITITSAITQYFPEASAFSDLRDLLFFLGALLLFISFIVVALSEAIVNGNKYVMAVVDFILIPFRWLIAKIKSTMVQFTQEKQLNEEQMLLFQSNRKRRNFSFGFITGFTIFFFLGVTVALILFLISDSITYFTWNGTFSDTLGRILRFFTKRPSVYLRDHEEYGILPAIIGSLLIILISAIVSFPISTATAIWLYEFSKENRFTSSIRQAIVNISAMPSIVVGIFVFAAFSVGLNMRIGLLPGGIALGILMIPIVTTNTIEALRNVPEYHKESALALGATEWEAFRKHRFPYAFPSIITGYILGLARVIGETAPILFTVAAVTNVVIPNQLTDQGIRLLPFEIFVTLKVLTIEDKNGERYGPIIASAIAMTLLAIVALLNVFAYYLRKILRSKYEYNGEL